MPTSVYLISQGKGTAEEGEEGEEDEEGEETESGNVQEETPRTLL